MKCKHDPKVYAGKPIGMYHCPECGNMVLAGMEHPDVMCNECMEKIENCICSKIKNYAK